MIKCDVRQIYNTVLGESVHLCWFYSEQMSASGFLVKAINTGLEGFEWEFFWLSSSRSGVCHM